MANTHQNMSLHELRQLATRQQERIESTHKMILHREHKLNLLKQDHNLNHQMSEYDKNLHRLKESISAQEVKLRQLRALKAQVQKQRSSNSNLCSELESIRTLFNEKEKELSVALTKVDALTRQLEELRKGNTTNSYHINGIANAKHGIELEKLRQELLYRSKMSEQNGHELMLKRGQLTQRQSEMLQVDQRIGELQQRLARKRQLNQQLSSQMHSNLIRANSSGVDDSGLVVNGALLRSSVGHMGHRHKSQTMRPLSANVNVNIAAVEPVLREQTARISEFDPHINANQDFMGAKHDPKYQTLPYNTKFGVRQHNPHLYQTSGHQLCVTTPDSDRNNCHLQNEKMSANSSFNNDNNNNTNSNHNNVSIITNNINSHPKLSMNAKHALLEERPSPSGSSGSSDRASLANHNGYVAYKMQQQMHMNQMLTSGQYPYQNVNPKMYSTGSLTDPMAKVWSKLNPSSITSSNLTNYKIDSNSMNSNQSVLQSHSVPTNSPNQTQSQTTSNSSKVPPNTKPKPVVPPKPSVPVKPIPPPRQSPNHLYGPQSQTPNETVDSNTFSNNMRNNANISYGKKGPNLLTTGSAPINTSSSGYKRLPLTSVAAQKAYNAVNSKSGLMIQQLPHHCQQQQQQHQSMAHSSEDRPQSHVSRNTSQLFTETTDGSPMNGPAMPSDITSSTSSLSSSLSSQTNSNNCDTKATITTTNTADNKSSINSNSFVAKIDDNDSNYSPIKSNGNTRSNTDNSFVITNNNNNNSVTDWHKAKRRPVVANNEFEQELALPDETAKMTSQSDQTQTKSESKSRQIQSNDCLRVDTNQVNDNENKIQCNFTEQKSDKSVDGDNESDINLIKQEPNESRAETNRQGFVSNSMTEDTTKQESKKCDTSGDTVATNVSTTKSVADLKRAKGSLKSQLSNKDKDQTNGSNGHPLISRRVSFDPLALLLDAALEGELELVKKTAKEVPNPSAANDEGITALHNAICAGHFDIVKYLVENGCDVNAQDSDGWTPLHCAASCNNLSMVKFLVEHGACIFATTLSDQETAAEKCEEDEEGFDGCSQYLYGVQEKLGVLNGSQVYAVYDYESQNADELSFKDTDPMTVLRKGDDQELDWWWTASRDRQGYVPRNLLGLYPRVKPTKELQTIAEDRNE